MKKTKVLFTLFEMSCFIMMLASMNAYFFWGIHIAVFYIFAIFCGILYHSHSKSEVKIPQSILLVFILPVLGSISTTILPIKTPLLCTALAMVVMLTNEKRTQLLRFCGKSYALILIVSLIFFLMSWGLPMPSFGYTEFGNYFYEKGLFYLKLVSVERSIRFTSIFLEPGHVGMICSFFLFAFRYEFKKWYVIATTIALLFTLSLAGYVLFILGYLLYSLSQNNWAIFKKLLLLLILLTVGLYAAKEYNNGNNLVNRFVIDRLEYDEDAGIVGNNRTDDITDSRFEKIIGTDVFWFGYDAEKYTHLRNSDINGAGYKIYILGNGVLGVFLILAFYLILALSCINRKFMIMLLILYILCFIQRAYPLWVAWLLPYICSMKLKEIKCVNRLR